MKRGKGKRKTMRTNATTMVIQCWKKNLLGKENEDFGWITMKVQKMNQSRITQNIPDNNKQMSTKCMHAETIIMSMKDWCCKKCWKYCIVCFMCINMCISTLLQCYYDYVSLQQFCACFKMFTNLCFDKYHLEYICAIFENILILCF